MATADGRPRSDLPNFLPRPDGVWQETLVSALGTLLFKNAFNRFDAGYASAMGLTMSFFAGIIICIFIVLRRRGWEI